MGIKEEVTIQTNFWGSNAFYDRGGKRFLFNLRADLDELLNMHRHLNRLSEDERWTYAQVLQRMEK